MKELSEKQENLIILAVVLFAFLVYSLALTGVFGPEIQATAIKVLSFILDGGWIL